MPHVLTSRMNALPMAPKTRPTFYWCDAINGWWPRLSRRHLGCNTGKGYLIATPPNTPSSGPGAIFCLQCAAELAEVLDGPTMPRPLPPEEPVKRGPKPKAVTQEKPRRYRPCMDCKQPTGRKGAERCRPCNRTLQSENALSTRLIVLLGHGPVRAVDIGRAFGLTPSGVRNLVRRARRRHPIGSTGAGHDDSRYWLEDRQP